MIVTLAGHVDHGKTTLVRLLTGTDTDRLEEERRRGLTIDLGFAYLDTGATTIGFVDVPGHHRFIHNMVAGVASRQHALLVIAADDGPMPQSREHLQILSLIGVQSGTVALTKCDRVDEERLTNARTEVSQLLEGSFLEDARVIETAAAKGEGLSELKAELLRAAEEMPRGTDVEPFRLAIDRAFTLKGAGVVVTGTVHAGQARLDQELYHFPSGRKARIRGIRIQNHAAEKAEPGDRAALNLVGIDAASIARGDWMTDSADPGHTHLVLELEVLDNFPRAIRQWMPVHVYHATTHSTARIAVIDQGSTTNRMLAELDCDAPLFAKHGDRVIIRDQGLDLTLGGGRVIDNRPRPRRRLAPQRLRELEVLRAGAPAESLAGLLGIGPVDLDAFQRIWDLGGDLLEQLLQNQPAARHGRQLVLEQQWRVWSEALLAECELRHREDETLQGLQENAFATELPKEFRGEILRALVANGRLEHRAGRYSPASHEIKLSPQEAGLLAKLKPYLEPPQPQSIGDIAKQLKYPLDALKRSVRPLIAKGVLVQINEKRLYLPEALRALADAAAQLGKAGPFSAAEFRDAAGIGRNIAIDVLEYLDAKRLTRRQGEERIVVGDPGALF